MATPTDRELLVKILDQQVVLFKMLDTVLDKLSNKMTSAGYSSYLSDLEREVEQLRNQTKHLKNDK